MQVNDKTRKPIEGYFILKQFDKNGNLIDTYEDNNKIMVDSKKVMRDAMRGLVANPEPTVQPNIHINTFVLGTQGHQDNLLVPKNFTYDEPDLFCVQALNGKAYPITFDSTGNIIDEGYDEDLPGSRVEASSVTINNASEVDNEAIEYIFKIPITNANDNGQPIAYTEAALYTNLNQIIPNLGANPGDPLTITDYGDLFAMRTFAAKIKDNATSFEITWRIIF